MARAPHPTQGAATPTASRLQTLTVAEAQAWLARCRAAVGSRDPRLVERLLDDTSADVRALASGRVKPSAARDPFDDPASDDGIGGSPETSIALAAATAVVAVALALTEPSQLDRHLTHAGLHFDTAGVAADAAATSAGTTAHDTASAHSPAAAQSPATADASAAARTSTAPGTPAAARTAPAARTASGTRTRHASRAGGAAHPPPVRPVSSPALRLIDARLAATPTATSGFISLLAATLADEFPAEAGRAVEVPVLFDRHVGGAGASATLRLVRLHDGPVGIHADPRTMSFLWADRAFAQAVAAAWATSPLAERDASVVWSLTRHGESIVDPTGGSLALAFAIALDELSPRSRLHRLLRRRALDTSAAATGGLAGREVTAVRGYDAKIAAAAADARRVIVPAVSADIGRSIGERLGVRVDAAADVDEAIRLSRTRLNGRFVVAASLTLALVLGGGAAASLTVPTMLADARDRATARASAALAADAVDLIDSDPRAAALSALASRRLDPNASSAAAVVASVEASPFTVRAVGAHSGAITAIAATDDVIVSAGDDGALSSRSVASLEPLALPVAVDDRTLSLTISPDGSTIVRVGDDGAGVHPLSADGRIGAEVALDRSSAPSSIVSVQFPFDDGRFVLVDADGIMTSYSADGVKSSAVDLTTLRPVGAVTASPAGAPAVVAATAARAAVGSGASTASATTYVATSVGGVVEFDPNRGALRVVVPAGALPGAITTMAADPASPDRLAIATDAGVVLWNTADRSPTSFPYAGVAGGASTVVWEAGAAEDGAAADASDAEADAADADADDADAVDDTDARADTVSAFAAVTRGAVEIVPTAADVAVVAGTQATEATAIPASGTFAVGHSDGRLTIEDPHGAPVGTGVDLGRGPLATAGDGTIVTTTASAGATGATSAAPASGAGDTTGLVALDTTGPAADADAPPTVITSYSAASWFGADVAFSVADIAVSSRYVVAGALAPGGANGAVLIWDRLTGSPLRQIPFTPAASAAPSGDADAADAADSADSSRSVDSRPIVSRVAILEDLGVVVAWNQRGATLAFFSLASGDVYGQRGYGAGTDAFAASPAADSVAIVTAPAIDSPPADRVLITVDAVSGRETSRTPIGNARAMASSPDARTLAVLDRTTASVDLRDRADPSTVRQGRILPAAPRVAAWSPDGSRIAVATESGAVSVLDGATLQAVVPTLRASATAPVSGIAWRDDETVVVSTPGATPTTALIDTRIDSWDARLCAIAGSTFTRAEWAERVGDDVPFVDLCPAP